MTATYNILDFNESVTFSDYYFSEVVVDVAANSGVMEAGGDLPDMKKNPTKHPDYKSPKGGDRKVRNPNGKGSGWVDGKGRVWVPTDHKGTHAPHWDREIPGGGHENVYPYMNPGFSITPEQFIKGAIIVGGAAIIIFDIVTIPSGEGLIGVEMIRRAVAP